MTSIYDNLFPEIASGLEEETKIQREDALLHPVLLSAITAQEARAMALEATEAGDYQTAELLNQVAQTLTAQISGGQLTPTPTEGGDLLSNVLNGGEGL